MDTYIFDWDGTLMSTGIYRKIYPILIKRLKEKLGLTEEEIYAKAEKDPKVRKHKDGQYDSGELCKALDEIDLYYEILKSEAKTRDYLFERTVPMLKNLKEAGSNIIIATNSFRSTIKLYIDIYQLHKIIDHVYSSEYAGCRKDSLKYWKNLIKHFNIDPKECLVEGDHPDEDFSVPAELGFNTRLIEN